MIDQDPAHGLSGDAEEVRAVLPLDFLIHQFQERLVDERGRLQGMARALSAQVISGLTAELLVDKGHQFVERLLVSCVQLLEQLGDVVRRITGRARHREQLRHTAGQRATSSSWTGSAQRVFELLDCLVQRFVAGCVDESGSEPLQRVVVQPQMLVDRREQCD